jgi:poly(A) polymerase
MRFRAAYDFLLLRCDTGEAPEELGKWWTDFQDCTAEQRREMINQAPSSGPRRRNRGRRRRGDQNKAAKPAVQNADGQAESGHAPD